MAVPARDEKEEVAAGKPEQTQVRRVYVVLNPVAGLTDADSAKTIVTNFCQERGWECEIHETEKNEDVRELIRDVLERGVDLVIAAGGDGTVSAVVAGMVNSKVPMGILPAGTGNALARDLAIPVNLNQAMSLFDSEYTTRTLDVMEVNGSRYYVLNVSVGVSAITMRSTKRHEKRRFGMLAYLYRAVGSIRTSAMHRFHVKIDGRPVRFAASELMIANSKFMGLQPQLDGVEVDPNDGMLDIFIVRAQSTRDYLSVISRFLMNRGRDEEARLNHIQARERIEIRSEFPLPVQADGEVIGNTPVSVQLIPNGLTVIIPKPASE